MSTEALRHPAASAMRPPRSNGSVGLWVFIGVATSLFSLFILAYTMRMAGRDWASIALPWQLWLSTALLVGGSVALQAAAAAARGGRWDRARAWLLAGGAAASAFLGSQLWAWQTLQAAQVFPSGNPAASFFYLLTAMHGLHVMGGLVGWSMTAHRTWPLDKPARAAEHIRLCARYWHFLLAVWLVLFATLGGVTPAVVTWICGPLGITR